MEELGTSNQSQPFGKKPIFWLIFLGLLASIGMAISSIFLQDGEYQQSSGANSFSYSAVGHKAFIKLLRSQGYNIQISQMKSEDKLDGQTSNAFLLEPPTTKVGIDRIEELTGIGPSLLVLPKRNSMADPLSTSKIINHSLKATKQIESLIRQFDNSSTIIRPEEPNEEWAFEVGPNQPPEISQLQLIKSENIHPLIHTSDGTLLGYYLHEYTDAPVYVLSDPDFIENHGIGDGWNADIIIAIAEEISRGNTSIVVDEVLHGFKMNPSLARNLFKPPLLTATLTALLALTFFLLAYTKRFGPIWPRQKQSNDSKAIFIANSARLLLAADREGEALRRYMERDVMSLVSKLNAPKDLGQRDSEQWLNNRAAARGISPSFTTLKTRIFSAAGSEQSDDQRLVTLACQFYEWKQEMLDDSAKR